MSLYGSLFSGVSALNAQSRSMASISDNIANVNTVGYKRTVAQFETLVTGELSSRSFSPGGVLPVLRQEVTQQGILQTTNNNLDLAISGEGMFVVGQNATPATNFSQFYTRAGSFRLDENGTLENAAGFHLAGYPLDANGNISATVNVATGAGLEIMNVGRFGTTAQASSTVQVGANLPATAAAAATQTITFDFFDTLGQSVQAVLTFTRISVANNSWGLTGATPATLTVPAGAANQLLDFDANGALQAVGPNVTAGTAGQFTLAYDGSATGAANPQNITLDVGTIGLTNGMTGYSSAFDLGFLNVDGNAPATVESVAVNENGFVTAVYSNGGTQNIYRIPLVEFANVNGLRSETGNVYTESAISGSRLFQLANTNGVGQIEDAALEGSTVDLAEEFSNMITTQQAYNAATRVITTADEMLDEVLRIKR